MALGVASLITVLSVMNGFGGELRGRILALVPHAYLQFEQSAEVPSPVLQKQLLALNDVEGVAPYTRETVLFSGAFRHQGAVLFGIDSEQQGEVTALDEFLLVGSLASLEEPFSVILGSTLARNLGVVPGDSVRVVLPQLTTTPLGVFPRSRMLSVVGLFEVGAQQDGSRAYTSMASAARLLRNRGQSGLQLRTNDLMQAPALGETVAPLVQGMATYRPWSETQGSLFRAIKMEKLTVSILLLSVVLVAAFNVVSTLVMAVTEKRRDIAVLRTMGATPGEISRIFITQGLSLSLLGVLLGTVLGVFLALNIADVVDFFERLAGARIFDPQVYFISRLPSKLLLTDVLAVVGAAALLSLCAVAYPAWRASRIAPAEVLRYE